MTSEGLNDISSDERVTRATRKRAERPARTQRFSWSWRELDPFFVTLVVLGLAKSAFTRGEGMGIGGVAPTLWLELAALVLLIGACALIPKAGRWLALALYSLLSVWLLLNAMYAVYFQQVFDPAMIALAGQTGAVGGVILELLKPIHLVFVIDIPLLLAWAIVLQRRHATWSRAAMVLPTALASGVLVLQIVLSLFAPAGVDATTVAASRGMAAMQISHVIGLALPEQESAMAGSSGAAAAAKFRSEMGVYADGVGGRRLAPWPTGKYKGYNVILIEWESLQAMLINGRIEGKEVTPNLNKLAGDGWFFPNTYAQTGAGNTSDAEFIANTGLLGPLTEPSSVAYSNREIPSLPRLLRAQQGYKSYTMHTNAARFWNRRELYPSIGFDRFFDASFFNNRDVMWLGSSDDVLLQEGRKLLVRESKEGTAPVLLEMVTMSSHTPWTFPEEPERRPLKLSPELADTNAGKMVTAMSYSDAAFGRFIERLKRNGMYNNTIIVVFGDHTGYQTAFPPKEDDAVLKQLLGGRTYNDTDRQRVAMIVRVPGERPRVVTEVRAHSDIMPTIADLTGLDLSQTPHVGRSAFVEAPRLVPTRYYYPGGTYVTDNVVFIPGMNGSKPIVYSVKTGTLTEPSERDVAAADLVRRINALSDDWIRSQPERADAKPLGDAIIPGPKHKKGSASQ